MALLLENIGLGLPFPHEQLALHFRGQSYPVARTVYWNAINLLLRDLKAMNRLEGIQIVKREHTVWLSDAHESICASIAADDSSLRWQVEFVLFGEKVAPLNNIILKLGHLLSILISDYILICLIPSFKSLLLLELLELNLLLGFFGFVVSPRPYEKSAVLGNRENILVVFTEEGWHYLFGVAWKGEWQKPFNFVQRKHLYGQIIAPSYEESWICGPLNTCNIVRMEVSILFVQNERWQSLVVNRRCLKYPEPLTACHGKKVGIRREFQGCDDIPEIKVCQNDLLLPIDDERVPINIHRNENLPIRRHSNNFNIAPVLKWECSRHIAKINSTNKIEK